MVYFIEIVREISEKVEVFASSQEEALDKYYKGEYTNHDIYSNEIKDINAEPVEEHTDGN